VCCGNVVRCGRDSISAQRSGEAGRNGLTIFGDPGDLKAVITAIELCRDIADSDIFRPFLKREITPGSLKGLRLSRSCGIP
jgi:choline dehydrogenase